MNTTALAVIIIALAGLAGCASTDELYGNYTNFCNTQPHIVLVSESPQEAGSRANQPAGDQSAGDADRDPAPTQDGQ